MEEILLGFDAREMSRGTAERLHPAHRLSTFLLREDVEKVLSADPLVWPAALEVAPRWIGPNAPFWEDLTDLERGLASAPPGVPYWLIAATWHRGGEARTCGGPPYEVPTRPAQRDTAWRLIGYDVVDGGYISGLSDCGYEEQERFRLAAEFAAYLNPHHLFSNLPKALEFRTLSDARVPEHAPFFVAGLWMLRDGGAKP
jgi:hypothetical protein